MIGPQAVVDAFIFALASIFTVISVAHIVLLWRARADFFVVVRSPRLACVIGVCMTTRYYFLTLVLVFGYTSHAHARTILLSPAWVVAEVATLLMAFRLLVMYYPSKRIRYGRCMNEKRLLRGLGYAYILTEGACWVAVAALDGARVKKVLVLLSQLAHGLVAIVTLCLCCELRNVRDLSNMSRDIRLAGIVMIVPFPMTLISSLVLRPGSLQDRYAMLAILALSHPPVVWILTIRPTRSVLGQAPERVAMTALRMRRGNSTRVAITELEHGVGDRRKSLRISMRMLAIMAFEPLRAAFGQFCHKSLCGESFQFIEDVFEFKNDPALDHEGDNKVGMFKGFGSFLGVVNDYIRDGSHSEINIGSKTKQGILDKATFQVYSSLNFQERREIFSEAEKEVLVILTENLLTKFILSRQYKEAVYSL